MSFSNVNQGLVAQSGRRNQWHSSSGHSAPELQSAPLARWCINGNSPLSLRVICTAESSVQLRAYRIWRAANISALGRVIFKSDIFATACLRPQNETLRRKFPSPYDPSDHEEEHLAVSLTGRNLRWMIQQRCMSLKRLPEQPSTGRRT
jgi:hypothetical protein